VSKYRRKPLEVTAHEVKEAGYKVLSNGANGKSAWANVGDWIITSPDYRRWICEKDVFPLLYEPIQTDSPR